MKRMTRARGARGARYIVGEGSQVEAWLESHPFCTPHSGRQNIEIAYASPLSLSSITSSPAPSPRLPPAANEYHIF